MNNFPDKVQFESPFIDAEYDTYDFGSDPRNLMELNFMKISGEIRRKPNWQQKVMDQSIVNKWKKELEGTPIFYSQLITPEIIDYIFDELQYLASQQDSKTGIGASSVDGVYESFQKISSELTQGLDQQLQVFESLQDWHPGSNNQVLDLVHPSMHCFVNGVSEELSSEDDLGLTILNPGTKSKNPQENWDKFIRIGRKRKSITENNQKSENESNNAKSKKRSGRKNEKDDYSLSKKYQWLPSDIQVDQDYSSKILSYINNIHPFQQKGLYNIIEQIFSHFVPLFEKVLTDYANPAKPRFHIDGSWYEGTEPNREDYDDSEEFDEAYEDWYDDRVPEISLKIPKFTQPKPPQFPIDLKGKKLQVIVKAANIILTPENPDYHGGVWHIEGMKNESIVATGLYYYKTENISNSELHFRNFIHDPEDYEQSDYNGVQYVYGLRNEEPDLNQPLGFIQCIEGKCIAFPNIYQHIVTPFSLVDKTKPGIRKILAFFLVDPTKEVKSTPTVLPQQTDWHSYELQKVFQTKDGNIFSKLIIDKIMSYINSMSLEEAQAHRAELMKERKFFINRNNEVLFERTVSLCEH